MKPTWQRLYDKPTQNLHKRVCGADQVMLSIHKTGPKPILAITVGEDIAQKLRWIPHDKVAFVANGKSVGLTLDEKGFTVHATSKLAKDSKVPVRCILKASIPANDLESLVPNGKPVIISDPQIVDKNILVIHTDS